MQRVRDLLLPDGLEIVDMAEHGASCESAAPKIAESAGTSRSGGGPYPFIRARSDSQGIMEPAAV
jgi:hypothetical protein